MAGREFCQLICQLCLLANYILIIYFFLLSLCFFFGIDLPIKAIIIIIIIIYSWYSQIAADIILHRTRSLPTFFRLDLSNAPLRRNRRELHPIQGGCGGRHHHRESDRPVYTYSTVPSGPRYSTLNSQRSTSECSSTRRAISNQSHHIHQYQQIKRVHRRDDVPPVYREFLCCSVSCLRT
nr:unnamed protein product [Callosobruchus analis]